MSDTNDIQTVEQYQKQISDMLDNLKIKEGETLVKLGKFLISQGTHLVDKGSRISENAKINKRNRAEAHCKRQSTQTVVYGNYECNNVLVRRQPISSVEKEDVLLLFIKSDAGASFVQKISNLTFLNSENDENLSEELFLNTFNLWKGTQSQFSKVFSNIIDTPETTGTISSLDFYIVKLKINKEYNEFRCGNVSPIERMDGFSRLCQDKVEIIGISKKQTFENSTMGSHTWSK